VGSGSGTRKLVMRTARVRMERRRRDVSDKVVMEVSSARLVSAAMWVLRNRRRGFGTMLPPQKGGNEA
jgi:hypothetical protein